MYVGRVIKPSNQFVFTILSTSNRFVCMIFLACNITIVRNFLYCQWFVFVVFLRYGTFLRKRSCRVSLSTRRRVNSQRTTEMTSRYIIYFLLQNKTTQKKNKNLCGRDGRTICGPLRVPKSTYVTLAHKRKPKFFFYFGCSLVRRCNCKQSTSANGRDGQTDRQRATQYAAPS